MSSEAFKKRSKRNVLSRRVIVMDALTEGKTQKEAGILAGFSAKTAQTAVSKICGREADTKKAFIQILEDEGLTDNFLGMKARSLIDAQQIHFFQKDGIVTDERSSPALETQRKTLELITKLKGHLKESSSSGDVSIGLMQVVVNAIQGEDNNQ
jgi:hypothetical protein